jgi:hypothetical protein
MSRQPPIGRQAALRTHPQRLQMAQRSAQTSRTRRDPNQEHLPPSALPVPAPTDRAWPRDRRRQALDPDHHLAHAQHRRDLPRPRRRLLRPPRPPTRHPTPRRPIPTPRPHRHPAENTRIRRRRIFPSVPGWSTPRCARSSKNATILPIRKKEPSGFQTQSHDGQRWRKNSSPRSSRGRSSPHSGQTVHQPCHARQRSTTAKTSLAVARARARARSRVCRRPPRGRPLPAPRR